MKNYELVTILFSIYNTINNLLYSIHYSSASSFINQFFIELNWFDINPSNNIMKNWILRSSLNDFSLKIK